MDSVVESIIRGALLHDIGKVIQRAQPSPQEKTHGQWGYEWLKDNLGDDLAASAAVTHHRKDELVFSSNFGLIWYQADNLSSSERKEKDETERGKWEKNIALASPFSRIANPNNPEEKAPITFMSLIRKTAEMNIALPSEPSVTRDDYMMLFKNFEADFNTPDLVSPHSIDLLLMLLEKHFSGVPSTTMKIFESADRSEVIEKHPDVSLFDHSKLTAAIAGCMCRYLSEMYPEAWSNNELLTDRLLDVPHETQPYLLIGGDISGVQRFIYTIAAKGALKSLKGRSFFLELLAEHVVSELIETLDLTRCNIIFSGGGHFYILSHNTPSATQVVKEVRSRIDQYLFSEFAGSLQLHIESLAFHPDSFRNATPVWGAITGTLEQAKKKKWQDRLQDFLSVSMPYADKDSNKDCRIQSCAVCFREDMPLKSLPSEDEPVQVCPSCLDQFSLGKRLISISKGSYPVLYKLPNEPEGDFVRIDGTYYQIRMGWDKHLHADAIAVYRINDFTTRHYSHVRSVYLPLGIYQHHELRELADAASCYGISRIAVLRMDVDNLGKIFSSAVAPEDRTFSRMASISRGFNNFFKYHLNDIVEGREFEGAVNTAGRNIRNIGRMVSIVYSGGDDLFIIGNWLDVIETSIDVNRCFRQFTGNRFVTISGGVAIGNEHYPVYQFARDAEEAEMAAKRGKNALTLFPNKVLSWENAEQVVERVCFFTRLLSARHDHLAVDEQKVPASFFYRLLSLSRRFNDEGILILPKAAYLISRMKPKNINPSDFLTLKEIIMNSSPDEWRITEAASMWVLMLMRKGGDNNA
jgi:CRISPR-associated protein Csm1